VAANLCTVAIGTETDGSIICPASANSIVGIKPTLGLVSRSGIIPIAHSQDTAGPMARTVGDAAILLGALTGVDACDPATQESRGKSYTDYTQFLDPDGMRGARIGVARNFFGFNERVDQLVDESIQIMKELGAEIVDPANVVTADQLWETEFEVLLYEFKTDLNNYLAGLGSNAPVRSLKDIIKFNERHRAKVMPYFGQDILLKAEEKGPLTDEVYVQNLCKNHHLSRTEGIDATLREGQLEAIVAPSGATPWLTDWVNGDHISGGSSSPAAVAGYPNITLPAGYIHGLPVGISFFAGAYQESTLIKLASAFEQATRVRQPPRFLASVDVDA
jgi:amidase